MGEEKQQESQKHKNNLNKKTIKCIRNFFKDVIINNFRTLFEQEDDYFKPIRAGSFWNK